MQPTNRTSTLSKWTALATSTVLLAATFAACDDSGAIEGVGQARIVALPPTVIFDEIAIGASQQQTFLLRNEGAATLEISGQRWNGNATDFTVESLVGMRLGPNESYSVLVTYSPQDGEVDRATLLLDSNASNAPTYGIDILSQGQTARIAADPGEVTLLAPAAGETVTGDLRLYNFGTEPFVVTDLRLVANNGEFALVFDPSQLPATISPEVDLTLQVTYTPTSGGIDAEQLLVSCNAENCAGGYFTVPINGITDSPRLRLTPGDVAFGAVAIDADPAPTRTITASNEGQGTLILESISWAFNPADGDEEFQVVSVAGAAWDDARTEPWRLGPAETMEIVVSYQPTDANPDIETLVFRSNDQTLPQQTVRIGGTPALPRLEVSPLDLEFPLTARDLTSDRTVTIRNAGAEPLELEPLLTLGGGFADNTFTLLNGDALPAELGAGEQFLLQVRFAPTVEERSFAGTIYVLPLNDPLAEEVRVNVTGTSTREPECNLRPVPTTINFGTVARGMRVEQSGRMRNVGSGPCEITAVTKQRGGGGGIFGPGRDFFQLVGTDRTVPFTLDAGDEFTITASYFPTSSTDLGELFGDTGSIEVRARDPYNTTRRITCGSVPGGFGGFTRDCGVNLQARSAVSGIAAIPNNLDFGLVTIGCNSQTQTVRVYNTGGADIDVTALSFEDCSGEFAIAGVPTFPRRMARGENFAFQVRYRPDNEGVDSCSLIVENTSNGRLVVPIRGEGVTYSRTVDRFEQVSGRDVDVLFVVDNSGSMSEEQSNLANNFGRFINAATTWGTNFQIGIVTTQTEGDIPNPSGGNRKPGELLGTPRIITPRTPSFQSVFQASVRVGAQNSSESASERGLEAAVLALSDPNITDFAAPCANDTECGGPPYMCIDGADSSPRACGGFNRTFLRTDASLEIIFVSDEEDSSRAELSFYIDFFKSIKGFRNTSLFHASSIVGPRGGCSSGSGSADAGNRYMDVSRETNGVIASICDANFGTALAEIGNRAFGLRVEFFLSRAADPATVRVFNVPCGGGARTPRTTGYTFDPASNSIVWDAAQTPQPGNCFEVEYDAACF